MKKHFTQFQTTSISDEKNSAVYTTAHLTLIFSMKSKSALILVHNITEKLNI